MFDLSNVEVGFAYDAGDEQTRKEIARNVKTIIATPLGTCPLYRSFGLDSEVLDKPLNEARSVLTVKIIEAVERWEPRVKVQDVSVVSDDLNGRLMVKVVVSVG